MYCRRRDTSRRGWPCRSRTSRATQPRCGAVAGGRRASADIPNVARHNCVWCHGSGRAGGNRHAAAAHQGRPGRCQIAVGFVCRARAAALVSHPGPSNGPMGFLFPVLGRGRRVHPRHGCVRHKLCRVFVDGKYCEWCGNRNVSQAPIPCAVPSFRWTLRVLVVRTGREGTSRRWQHTPSCWTR